jgi:hypothetical protein
MVCERLARQLDARRALAKIDRVEQYFFQAGPLALKQVADRFGEFLEHDILRARGREASAGVAGINR